MSGITTKSLADHFAEQAERQPQAPALIWDGEAISYAELQQMADGSHAELQDANLPDDRPVGVRAKKSPEAIGLILACLRARLSFLLPSVELAPETLAKLFAQAGTSQVVSPHGPRSQSAATLRALVDSTTDRALSLARTLGDELAAKATTSANPATVEAWRPLNDAVGLPSVEAMTAIPS